MQKVKGLLTGPKPARQLQDLTDQPLSICQKLLSGHRVENREMLTALLRTRLIADVILAVTEGASDPTVKAVRKAVKCVKLERELARLKAGDDE
jgi:hypothetical protein